MRMKLAVVLALVLGLGCLHHKTGYMPVTEPQGVVLVVVDVGTAAEVTFCIHDAGQPDYHKWFVHIVDIKEAPAQEHKEEL